MSLIDGVVRRCAEQLRADAAASSEGRERRERQYQILVRCDLGREPHEAVAADLGLSRRQFYRERREASEYLAHFVKGWVREHVLRPHTVTVDRFALELARAKALRLAGDPHSAERLLRNLVGSDGRFARKVEPWCNLVDILVNDNRSEEADRQLLHLQGGLSDAPGLTRSEAEHARARIDMQVASYLWFQGRMREALALDERVEGAVVGMSRSPHPDAREFFIKTRIRQTNTGLMTGTIARARDTIEEARASLAGDDLPLALRIEFLIVYGTLKDHAVGRSDETIALAVEALELAKRHGLVELVIDAMLALASAAQLRGDWAAGRRYIDEILPIAESSALPAAQGIVLNVAAISEASLGRHELAVQLARRARAVLPRNSRESIYSSLAEAHAHLSTGGFREACEPARDAFHAAAAIGSDRLAGTALRLLAEGEEGNGRIAEAREHIIGAIAALEREGPPAALRQAYEAAARITGDRRYRRTASELATTLDR